MEYNQEGYISLIIGPMYSGKTTELIKQLNTYSLLNMKVLYINHILDNRSDIFSTHNPSIKDLGRGVDGMKSSDISLEMNTIMSYDVIGIDEAQLFDKIYDVIMYIAETLNKRVIVAGLSGDYKRELFGELYRLLPVVDDITKLHAYCKPCLGNNNIARAHFSKRITLHQETVLIGASDSYIPVCRKCYKN
jgi:thymidine kinase